MRFSACQQTGRFPKHPFNRYTLLGSRPPGFPPFSKAGWSSENTRPAAGTQPFGFPPFLQRAGYLPDGFMPTSAKGLSYGRQRLQAYVADSKDS